MRVQQRFLVLVLMMLLCSTAHAFDYVKMKPLRETKPPTIKDCRKADPLVVPMRTSGAHIVPLFGNGYDLETGKDSLFKKEGLNIRLMLENSIVKQLENYMSCKSPFMAGTQGMINAVADVAEADPRTRMVAVYQHAWSNGGDALVVRDRIKTPADLSGSVIVTQAYGPHLEYLTRVLSDAERSVKEKGGTWKTPEILYTEALLGFSDHTPGLAFFEDDQVDAAFMVKPDAMLLTSGGKIGTGAEGSVKGAHILLSTKSASRLISEIYVVRRDFFEAERDTVKKFVQALFKAEEVVRENVLKLIVDWEAVARHLLDDPGAIREAENLWTDIETVGMKGNVDWVNPSKNRSFQSINNEIQNALTSMGLMKKAYAFQVAKWDYGGMSGDLFDQRRASLPGFDENMTGKVVDRMKKSGELEKETLFEFNIHFKPNQRDFSETEYKEEFERVIELSSTYAGAVLTIEGHSDPLNYLRQKAKGAPQHQLRSIRQSAKNLSINRAISVRDSIIQFADERGVTLDESQFVTVGYGVTEPKTGICGGDPCPPKTEAEWLSNMRVNFRMVQVEAEASVFTPLNTW